MLTRRVIPVLLLRAGGLYKGVRFSQHKYVGDPINAIKIFNEKQVDELVVLDIAATIKNAKPDLSLLESMASEAFMPMAYGGGLNTIEDIGAVFRIGFEKVVMNTAAIENPALVSEAAGRHGSQSVVVCIDAQRSVLGGHRVLVRSGTKRVPGVTPSEVARRVADAGAGEIIVNSVDRDGTLSGYDLPLIREIGASVGVPVVALGGASTIDDFAKAVQHGASAVAAGAMFVFQGPHRAVLISYPNYKDLERALDESSDGA